MCKLKTTTADKCKTDRFLISLLRLKRKQICVCVYCLCFLMVSCVKEDVSLARTRV